VSISINQNVSPANFLSLESLSNSLYSGLNTGAQSTVMQSMSQLLGSLGQLFSAGPNSQFTANPLFGNLGNSLGNGLGTLPMLGGQASQFAAQALPLGAGALDVDNRQAALPALQKPQVTGSPDTSPLTITINNSTGGPVSIAIDRGAGQAAAPAAPAESPLPVPPARPVQPMTAERAAEVLNRNFDNISGGKETVDRNDLRRVMNDPNCSAEMRQAASFLLNNPDAMRQIETADLRAQGKCSVADGRISKGDTGATMALSGSPSPQESKAAAALLANKDALLAGDNLISREELGMIALTGKLPNGQPAPADLKEAARYFTENPEKFNKLENANFYRDPTSTSIPKSDGKIGLEDLQIMANGGNGGNGAPPAQQPMTAERAVELLNRNFDNLSGGKETVDRSDLRRAVNDPNSSPELKQAASFLLNNPQAYRQLETADQRATGPVPLADALGDGRISKGDTLASMALSGSPSPQESKAMAALLANKDIVLAGDSLSSREELAMIALTGKLPNGQPAPADLLEAARFLTENPEKFNKLENAFFYRNPTNTNIPKGDGKIGLEDLQGTAGA
jgi:hypothetical protein